MGRDFNKTMSPEALRQTLRRARKAFANLLLDEVERSLADRDLDQLKRS